jgi:hypothetical protein
MALNAEMSAIAVSIFKQTIDMHRILNNECLRLETTSRDLDF